MTKQLTDRPADPGLQSLLQLEQRLRARVEAARAQALARLEAARAEVEGRADREAAQFDAAAGAEEQADLERHRARLAALLAEHAETMRRLNGVDPRRIDALARLALARAIETSRQGSR